MNAIMMQITSVNKMVSKQEESETSKKRHLKETEVWITFVLTKITVFRMRKNHPFWSKVQSVTSQ